MPNDYQNDILRFLDRQRVKIERWFRDTFNLLENAAAKKLKWRTRPGKGLGGRARGDLARSITHEGPVKTGGVYEGKWGTNKSYAPKIEGYPEPPPKQFITFSECPDLKVWARRHGINVENRRGLVVGGESSTTPFMRPTLEENKSKISTELQKALRV